MKRVVLLLLLFEIWSASMAQVLAPLQTLTSAGGATGAVYPGTNIPTYFASIGQPMVYARPVKESNGGGVMNANDIMWSVSVVDTNPPTVTYESSSTLSDVIATVIDDKSISDVKIFYRPIAGLTFDSMALTPSASVSHGYESTTLNQKADAMGLEFYFRGKDSRNVTRDPAGTSTYFLYAVDAAAKVPATLLSYGTEPKNYRMISVPYDVAANLIKNVFTDLNPADADKSKYRIWKYTGGQWSEYSDFTTIDRGLGYFIILSNTSVGGLNLGAKKAPTNNRANLFTLPLSSDWNLIGNPYTLPINWNDVLALNGNLAGVGGLKVFNGTTYDAPTTLQPFQGAFVKVTGSAPSNFKIGFAGQTTPGGRIQETITSDLSSPAWELPLLLRQLEMENPLAGIGMRPLATQGLDRYDDYSPPHFFDYIEMISQRPELEVKDLTKDIVNTQDSYVWRFESKSNSDEEVGLSWDNIHFGDNHKPLYLYDIGRNEVVDMRQENEYKFSPSISKQFKIYFGIDKKDISPDELTMNAPFPNPFREEAEFRFALPGVNDSFQVELAVLNSFGQRVRSVAKGTYPSGRYIVNWNGNSDDNEKAAAGLYYYRLAVDGKQTGAWSGRIVFAPN